MIMPRAPRVDFPEAVCHVTSRGNGRAEVLWSMEEETRRAFREIGGVFEDDLTAIQDCYCENMEPVVSEEQLAALRRRYGLERKQV